MICCSSAGNLGRPTRRDFHINRNVSRCQAIKVAGLTMRRADFHSKKRDQKTREEASCIRQSSRPNLVFLVEGQLLAQNRFSAIKGVREWKLDRTKMTASWAKLRRTRSSDRPDPEKAHRRQSWHRKRCDWQLTTVARFLLGESRFLRYTEFLRSTAIHVGHSTGGGEVVHYLARHGEGRVARAAILSAVQR